MGTKRPHVLIVEDSQDDQMLYAYFLIKKGYHVTEACDGIEALDKARALLPDLILLDMWLPLLSGWDVVKQLNADELTKNIPVVVVTGHAGLYALQCHALLTKPCSLDELSAVVASGVASHALEAPPPQVV